MLLMRLVLQVLKQVANQLIHVPTSLLSILRLMDMITLLLVHLLKVNQRVVLLVSVSISMEVPGTLMI